MYRPEHDVVRTPDDPDPGAGLFATAETDRLLARPGALLG
jgi:hypothetical protein